MALWQGNRIWNPGTEIGPRKALLSDSGISSAIEHDDRRGEIAPFRGKTNLADPYVDATAAP